MKSARVLLAVICTALFSAGCADPVGLDGIVVDKIYTPSHSGTSYGYGVTTGGKFGHGMVTSYRSERYTLIVKAGDDVQSMRVSAESWAEVTNGQPVSIIADAWGWSFK